MADCGRIRTSPVTSSFVGNMWKHSKPKHPPKKWVSNKRIHRMHRVHDGSSILYSIRQFSETQVIWEILWVPKRTSKVSRVFSRLYESYSDAPGSLGSWNRKEWLNHFFCCSSSLPPHHPHVLLTVSAPSSERWHFLSSNLHKACFARWPNISADCKDAGLISVPTGLHPNLTVLQTCYLLFSLLFLSRILTCPQILWTWMPFLPSPPFVPFNSTTAPSLPYQRPLSTISCL